MRHGRATCNPPSNLAHMTKRYEKREPDASSSLKYAPQRRTAIHRISITYYHGKSAYMQYFFSSLLTISLYNLYAPSLLPLSIISTHGLITSA